MEWGSVERGGGNRKKRGGGRSRLAQVGIVRGRGGFGGLVWFGLRGVWWGGKGEEGRLAGAGKRENFNAGRKKEGGGKVRLGFNG